MSIGGYVFNIDPSSASWTCRLNTRSFDTYGGRVVQILSSRVENLQLTGYITSKQPGWAADEYQWGAMEDFEYAIRSLMESEAESKSPSHFSYPELGWDAEVYVSGYSNVEYNPKTSAVSYTLALAVDSGLDGLADGSAASADFEGISDGVNWVRTKYNTPTGENAEMSIKALEKSLNTLDEFNADNKADFYKLLQEVIENPDDVGKGDSEGASAASGSASVGDSGSSVEEDPEGGSVGQYASYEERKAAFDAQVNADFGASRTFVTLPLSSYITGAPASRTQSYYNKTATGSYLGNRSNKKSKTTRRTTVKTGTAGWARF